LLAQLLAQVQLQTNGATTHLSWVWKVTMVGTLLT